MIGGGFPVRRRLGLVFLTVMLLLGSTFAWLAWGLLDRDRNLAAQRLAERRESAADQTIAALEKRLSGIEQDLSRLIVSDAAAGDLRPAEGSVFVRFESADNRGVAPVRAWPEGALLYYPELPDASDLPAELFAKADELEFNPNNRDRSASIAELRRLAASENPAVRVAALARIAGSYLHGGEFDESLKVYAQLADLGRVPVGGMPAALAAHYGTLAVFERRHDREALVGTARRLMLDLESARWPISFPAYQTLAETAHRFLPAGERVALPGAALAEAVQQLWDKWNGDAAELTDGRANVDTPFGAVLLVWRTSGDAVAGFAAGADFLERAWLADIKPMLEARQSRLVLTTPAGGRVFGDPPATGARPVTALAQNTQLPWTIQTFSEGTDDAEWRSRRNLLVAGMAVLGTLILAGTGFIGHTVSRELAVARLQSDFVSAVSHEFRTPLTTLCQLSEMLTRGRVPHEENRSRYYALLFEESRRLHRLVESLLNFGRLESGKLQFRFEELDAAALLRQSASEFSAADQAQGYQFEVETGDSSVIRADRETLRCVFWNLFENAVKYSPDCRTVWVNLAKKGAQVEIAVRDRGIGIPRREQRRIFEKFVRGAAARNRGIRGTGIGLALARQIVRAHGGDIVLESEPGKGSTFRVLLPAKV